MATLPPEGQVTDDKAESGASIATPGLHRVTVVTGDAGRLDHWLHSRRSVADLEAMGEDLREGVRVLLCRPGVFETVAELRFQHEVNCWVAYPRG
jgi:hypothetical protein